VHPAQSGDSCQIEQANFVRQMIVDVFGDSLEAPFLQGSDLPSTLICLAGAGCDLAFRLQAGEPDRNGEPERFRATSIVFQFNGMQRFGKRVDNMVNGLISHRAKRMPGLIDTCRGGRHKRIVEVIEK
jgi:hypothetical protein